MGGTLRAVLLCRAHALIDDAWSQAWGQVHRYLYLSIL